MKKYSHKEIEKKIQEKWKEAGVFKTDFENQDKEKFYLLDMFPYPSGEGLHMGHTEQTTIMDTLYRYKRMKGFNVLHPQGFDAFGLPAENYAVKTGIHPAETIAQTTQNFEEQMASLGLGYDFLNGSVTTSNPKYYKWTQWLFGKFFENDLVYKKTAKANWCSSCNTIIANEQIEGGKCERCKTEIEQKDVPSWMFRITDFADDLIWNEENEKKFGKVDWPEYTKKNQNAWIGKSVGAKIKFNVKFNKKDQNNVVLIHGCPGDDEIETIDKHWQPWLMKELEKNNISSSFPLVLNPAEPDYDEWKNELEKSVINKNTTVVAWSCGASFVVKWLGETQTKIKKLILVAPWKVPLEKYSDAENDLYNFEIDESINNNIGEVVIFTSDNADENQVKSVEIFSDTLNTKVIELKNHGHFTEGDMGKVEFPELLEEVLGNKIIDLRIFSDEEIDLKKKSVYGLIKNDKGEYLIQFFENNKTYWWPGGAVEAGEDFAEALKREIIEETGYTDFKIKNKIVDVTFDFVKFGTEEKSRADASFYEIELLSDKKQNVEFTQGEKDAKIILKWMSKEEIFSEVDSKVELERGKVIKTPLEIVEDKNKISEKQIEVFTTRPDTLFGATYMVLAPEHSLIQEWKDKIENWEEVEKYIEDTKKKTELDRLEGKEKTGVELKGVKAVNPAVAKQPQNDADGTQNDAEIPIFISDYVLAGYGTGAIMAVPAHDERDYDFVQTMNAKSSQNDADGTQNDAEIEIKQVIAPYIKLIGKDAPRKDENVYKFKAASAIIKHPEEEKFLLLTFQDEQKGLVGGRIEDNETPEEAILRELREETIFDNFSIKRLVVEKAFSRGHKTRKSREELCEDIIFEVQLNSLEKVSEWESAEKIKEGKWYSKEEVLNSNLFTHHKFYFEYYLENKKTYTEKGALVNSGQFNWMSSEEAKQKITEFVGGEMTATYRLRDWSISRQRYWGTPIPIVYDPEGKAHFVGEENLPWKLPTDVDFVPTGEAPLAKSKELKERVERIFGEGWTPEVDTMDTFVDSSWYFLRYPDPNNENEFASQERLKEWMPVDLYIGGAEHTYMHLLYARFFTHAMHKIGLIDFSEPFLKLRHQGMVNDIHGKKMSKSKGNVVNPDEMVERFGADATRAYMLFAGPIEDDKMWNEDNIVGIYRWIEKIWRQQEKLTENENLAFKKELHKTIKSVTENIENLRFNVAISDMMKLMNFADREKEINKSDYFEFIKLASPIIPHAADEILGEFNIEKGWPAFDEELAKDDLILLAVQVNGKKRGEIEVSPEASEEGVVNASKENPEIAKWLEGEIVKVIYVPGRILNFVVK